FLDSLPDILQAGSFRAVVRAIAEAAANRRAVVCMMGGHVVKTGLGPVIADLVERGIITHLASNGSTVIHDYEMARWGGTSEDVEAGLADGTFGMAEETGRGMNEAIREGARNGWGLGEALGRDLEARTDLAHPELPLLSDARTRRGMHESIRQLARNGWGLGDALGRGLAARTDVAHPELSLLLAARRAGIHSAVHAAIGAEIIHQHPAADGAAIGATSHT